jgi:hypothetical protein
MDNVFALDKWIWDQSDFDELGWHDSRVYSVAFIPETYELALDIDYIFKWVDPAAGEEHFTFWVAPVSIYFENVSDIELDVKVGSDYEIEISELRQQHIGKIPKGELDWWQYEIECQNGLIALKATGFKFYVRKAPVHKQSQCLTIEERGGVNFGRERIET